MNQLLHNNLFNCLIAIVLLLAPLHWTGIKIRLRRRERIRNPFPLLHGYVIEDKQGGEFVAPREIAHRAARTGDYTIRLATYMDTGNNYQNDGIGTPGGGWVPGGMLVDDGTIHKYKDERLN